MNSDLTNKIRLRDLDAYAAGTGGVTTAETRGGAPVAEPRGSHHHPKHAPGRAAGGPLRGFEQHAQAI
jgi:hypothetical protein